MIRTVTLPIKADVSQIVRVLRVVAKHLAALADGLESAG